MSEPARPRDRAVFQRLDQTAGYPYSLSEYARRFGWLMVQATLVRFSPARCYGWRRVWLRAFGARVTATSRTRPSTRIMHPWLLSMGEHSMIGDRVKVYNLGPISVGDHSVVSQDATLCAGTHDYTRPDMPLQRPPIVIGSGVWVCAEAFVGPGVTVGDNVVVGARAVVMGDVEPGVVVAGNPARVVKRRAVAGTADERGPRE
jgi:putative colanic acid biosynthesis acetyltransferase WcaF